MKKHFLFLCLLVIAVCFSLSTIAQTPPAPGVISGTSAVCEGGQATFSIAPVAGAVSYQWGPGGGPLSAPGGTNSTSVTIQVADNYPTPNFNLVVRAIGPNGEISAPSPTKIVTVYKKVTLQPVISGPSQVSPGQIGVAFSTPGLTGISSYTWNADPGISIVSGNGTKNVTVNFSAGFSGGNIRVAGVNGPCGISPYAIYSISVPPVIPPAPGSISGTSAVCEGGQATFSIAPVPGAVSYQWVPGGGPLSIIGGSNSTSVTIHVADPYPTANFNLVVTAVGSSGGVSAPSPTKYVTVYKKVRTQPVINGPNSVSPGQTGVNFSTPGLSGINSYVWIADPGITIVSGHGSKNITVNFASSFTSGNIRVAGLNGPCGPGPFRAHFISCGAGGRLANDNRDDRSNIFEDTRDFATEDGFITLYPNPAQSQVTFSYFLKESSNVKLSIYDLSGRLVDVPLTGHIGEGFYELNYDVSQLKPSVYLYTFVSNGYSITKQLVVIK